MKKIILSLAVVVCIASCGSQKAKNLELGDSMPSFALSESVTSQTLLGKPTLIMFFTTWCPACTTELPRIQELYDMYKEGKKINILGVAREQTAADIDSMWVKNGFTIPAYPDPDRKVFSLFAEKTIPRCYLFDASGKLVYKMEGYSLELEDELFKAVDLRVTF